MKWKRKITALPPSSAHWSPSKNYVFPGEVGTGCYYVCKTKFEALNKKLMGWGHSLDLGGNVCLHRSALDTKPSWLLCSSSVVKQQTGKRTCVFWFNDLLFKEEPF